MSRNEKYYRLQCITTIQKCDCEQLYSLKWWEQEHSHTVTQSDSCFCILSQLVTLTLIAHLCLLTRDPGVTVFTTLDTLASGAITGLAILTVTTCLATPCAVRTRGTRWQRTVIAGNTVSAASWDGFSEVLVSLTYTGLKCRSTSVNLVWTVHFPTSLSLIKTSYAPQWRHRNGIVSRRSRL